MILKRTVLPDGKLVSTVLLCRLPAVLHLQYLPSAIGAEDYETLVFPTEKTYALELDGERYDTEEEARQGHERMVAKWLAKGAAQ